MSLEPDELTAPLATVTAS